MYGSDFILLLYEKRDLKSKANKKDISSIENRWNDRMVSL